MTSLTELKKAITEMDPKLSENDDAFRAALVVLGPMVTGATGPLMLATFLRLPVPFVTECWERLVAAGIFEPDEEGLTFVPTDDWPKASEGSGTSFWLDVSVALGDVEVSNKGTDGKDRRFRISDQGVSHVEAMGTINEWEKRIAKGD